MLNSIPLYVTSLDVFHCLPPTGRIQVPARGFHSLSLCLSGKGDICTANYSACSRPGSITFMPAGTNYTSIINDTREIIVIHFTIIGTLPDEPRVIIPTADDTIAADFTRLLEMFDSVNPEDSFACMSRFYRLLGKLFDGRGFRTAISGFDRRILPALNYIHEHYASHQAADIEYLASLCGFTSAYLRRIFVKEFGIPTSTYVKQFRLNRAKTLLNSGYYSVTEVAGRCGFDSPSYFAKEFRKYTGFTPQNFAMAEHD